MNVTLFASCGTTQNIYLSRRCVAFTLLFQVREGFFNSFDTSMDSQTLVSDWKATPLGVAPRFAQTLLKLPDCVDTNPVKMAFSIAKAIIQILKKMWVVVSVSRAQADYYLRRLETTRTSLRDEQTPGCGKGCRHRCSKGC